MYLGVCMHRCEHAFWGYLGRAALDGEMISPYHCFLNPQNWPWEGGGEGRPLQTNQWQVAELSLGPPVLSCAAQGKSLSLSGPLPSQL